MHDDIKRGKTRFVSIVIVTGCLALIVTAAVAGAVVAKQDSFAKPLNSGDKKRTKAFELQMEWTK